MQNQDIPINCEVAEIFVSYSHHVPSKERIKVTSHKDAEKVFRYAWDDRTIELYESFKVILLNRNNRLLGVRSISEGGMAGTVVDVRLIFSIALKTAAHSIVIAHNHPSGNLNPSESDITLTKKIRDAGKILDISILDHLIITKDDFYSFADNNHL